ncbi:MAG: hypothetical protein EXQ58_08865 [Acidobacteria bacterium]|nr:hypothetical protein [Acidobacteriota bacterium]
MKMIISIGLLVMFAGVETTHAAAPTLSYDGRTLSLSAKNQTFGQVMGLFQRQLGLELDIPGDLNRLRLPLVEIKNLSMREALLKVLEGSNYDYILVASPEQSDRVRKLVVPGKSARILAAAGALRSMNRPVEDPFGGGVETSFEDNANVQPEPVPAPPVQIAPVNPNQPGPVGVAPQQAQPQGPQPFNPFGNQNNRRSPY